MKIKRRFLWRREDGAAEVVVESRRDRRVVVRGPEGDTIADCASLPDGRMSVILPSGRQATGRAVEGRDGRIEAWLGGRRLTVDLVDALSGLASEAGGAASGSMEVRAQIPGRVVEVRVAQGDVVAAGTTLLVLEAMKMQNDIRAESPARVAKVECAPGQAVEAGALLVRLEPEPAG